MNTKILQKCVDELAKEAPNLPYVRGILETLIEMDTGFVSKPSTPITTGGPVFTTTGQDLLGKADEIITDEDKEYARKMAGGPLGKIS